MHLDDFFDLDEIVDEIDDKGVEYDDIDPPDDSEFYDIDELSANASSDWENERDKY